MRGTFGLFKKSSSIGSTGRGFTAKISAFSTSSAGGSSNEGGDGGQGRGRGRGGPFPPKFNFVSSQPGKDDSGNGLDDMEKLPPSSGVGHGRGKPLASTPYTPSLNSFIASNRPSQQQSIGRGRGGPLQRQPHESGNDQDSTLKSPINLKKDDTIGSSYVADSESAIPHQPIGETPLPESTLNVRTGSGRGVPARREPPKEVAKEENRHHRPHPAPIGVSPGPERGKFVFESGDVSSQVRKPKMTREEAVKKAVGILSKGDEGDGQGRREVESGDGRGRGRGRGRRGERGAGRGRGRGRERRRRDDEGGDDDDTDEFAAIYVGDGTEGEKLAKALGPAVMNELTEAFEEMSSEVLPDPAEDEEIDALDTNLKIELEPEYLFGDFEKNPDIDEKPPMPLREALEKMKPFLMTYEGIESQEEWEEVLKETMERVPLLKKIVDHYSGPDRVTAKQQQGELERVAKTLPSGAPDSVRRFTDRAVLSLQSNPGWGFDKKCQFMDKLVDQFSKSYK